MSNCSSFFHETKALFGQSSNLQQRSSVLQNNVRLYVIISVMFSSFMSNTSRVIGAVSYCATKL